MDTETTTQSTAATDFQVKVADNGMTVTVECSAEYLRNHDLIAEVQAELASLKVVAEFNLDSFRQAVEQAREQAKGLESLVVVRGLMPVKPVDASLEWARDFFEKGYYVDPESECCDFHEMVARRSVDKEELLVTIVPPTPGTEGKDVYGRPVKVSQPRAARLRPGPNVFWDEKIGGYRANIKGRVRLTGDILDVDDVYAIRGDVGPETGNIHHPGAVVVHGNVVSEYRIEAEGSVDIKGHLYASEIKCDGDLTVANGINAGSDKSITVGGNLKAGHISNARITCQGDVLVRKEICNSSVSVRGFVTCQGRVVGGVVTALKGLKIAQAGSEKETTTVIVAGVDYALVAAIKEKANEITSQTDRLSNFQQARKQLQLLGNTLTPEQREKVTALDFEIMELEEQCQTMETEKAEMVKKMFEGRTAQIRIDKIIYPGTTLRILNRILEIDEEMKGPLTASFDNDTQTITLQ